MLNSENRSGKVRLDIKADTEQTEIFVIDGEFRRVNKGLGNLNIELPPGIYDVKFKSGGTIDQVTTVLEPGQKEVSIAGPKMGFSSPAPLIDTRTTHEYHRESAKLLSRQVHETIGNGSELFVFTRDLEPGEPGNTMHGLTLHALSGQMLVDYSAKGRIPAQTRVYYDGRPAAGCTVRVNPGLYRLRVHISDTESIEQMVVACQGWQTQLFLNVDDYVPGAPGRFPDLTSSSIFMARQGQGFDAGRPELRWTELARQGLVDRRKVVSQRDLESMLWVKFENPVFGIYAAYLMLLEPDPDITLLEKVTSNLYSLVGDHPDVRALAIYLAEKKGEKHDFTPYFAPPMLKNAWDIIVNATSTMPDIVPLASLASKISDRLWGYGLWLIWLLHPDIDQGGVFVETDAAGISQKVNLAPARDIARGVTDIATNRRDLQKIADQVVLTPIEQDLLTYLFDTLRQNAPASKITKSVSESERQMGSFDERFSTEMVVRALHVPASVATATLESLNRKLGELFH